MRKMSEAEIRDLFDHVTWGTLCAVKPDGESYGVEFTCFADADEICAIINPRGTIAACIRHQPRVCFKICQSGRLSRGFRAASFFGTARFVEPASAEQMLRAWELLETRMQAPDAFARAKEKYGRSGNFLPIFRLQVERVSGVTSNPDCAGSSMPEA